MKDFLSSLLVISLTSSLLLLFILILKRVKIIKKAALRNILWVAILIRLLFPATLNLPIGILDSQSLTAQFQNEPTVSSSEMISDYGENYGDNLHTNIVTDVKANVAQIISFAYFSAAIVLLSFVFIKKIVLDKEILKLNVCNDTKVLQAFDEARQVLNVKRKIPILIDDKNIAPGICGIIHPRIIIPKKSIVNDKYEELKFIFIHELYHYKSFDVVKLFLIEAVSCIHWFNPILFFIKKVIVQDIELACDEKVLNIIDKTSRADYEKMLIDYSANYKYRFPFLLTSKLTGKSTNNLKERITMIKNFNNKKASILSISAVIVLLTLMLAVTSCQSPSAINVNSNNDTYDAIYSLLEERCGEFELELSEKDYSNAAQKLVELIEDDTNVGSDIREILSNDLGLTPYQITNDDERLDTALANLITDSEDK